MRRTSTINVMLTAILLITVISLFSVIIAKKNYEQDSEKIKSLLADRTIVDYFSGEPIETTYRINGKPEELILTPICVDCDQSINNMYNSKSLLIVSAPESLCDTEVERCVVYNFDPFGLNIFEHQEILRNEK